jgi:hypothetical protein
MIFDNGNKIIDKFIFQITLTFNKSGKQADSPNDFYKKTGRLPRNNSNLKGIFKTEKFEEARILELESHPFFIATLF